MPKKYCFDLHSLIIDTHTVYLPKNLPPHAFSLKGYIGWGLSTPHTSPKGAIKLASLLRRGISIKVILIYVLCISKGVWRNCWPSAVHIYLYCVRVLYIIVMNHRESGGGKGVNKLFMYLFMFLSESHLRFWKCIYRQLDR